MCRLHILSIFFLVIPFLQGMHLQNKDEKNKNERRVVIYNKKKSIPKEYIKYSHLLGLLVHDFQEPCLTSEKNEQQKSSGIIDQNYKNWSLAKKLIELNCFMESGDKKTKKKASKALKRMVEKNPEKTLMTAAYWGIKVHERVVDFASAKPYYGMKLPKSMDRWLARTLMEQNSKAACHVANYALCYEKFIQKEYKNKPLWFYKNLDNKSLTVTSSQKTHELIIVPGGVEVLVLNGISVEGHFFLHKPHIVSLCKNRSGDKIALINRCYFSVKDTTTIPWKTSLKKYYDALITGAALMHVHNKIAVTLVNNEIHICTIGTERYKKNNLFSDYTDHLFIAPTVCALDFTPDDCRFAVLFTDETIRIYATDSVAMLQKIACDNMFINQLCFSDDGQVLGYAVNQLPKALFGAFEPKKKLFNDMYNQLHHGLTFDQAELVVDSYKNVAQEDDLVLTKKDSRRTLFLQIPLPLRKIFAKSCKIKTFKLYPEHYLVVGGSFLVMIYLYFLSTI